jgi:hypothetical protein
VCDTWGGGHRSTSSVPIDVISRGGLFCTCVSCVSAAFLTPTFTLPLALVEPDNTHNSLFLVPIIQSHLPCCRAQQQSAGSSVCRVTEATTHRGTAAGPGETSSKLLPTVVSIEASVKSDSVLLHTISKKWGEGCNCTTLGLDLTTVRMVPGDG